MNMPKRIRSFIAVELPKPLRDRIMDLQDRLAGAVEHVKWVEAENIHLTLKFLGEVDEGDIYQVCKAAQRAVAAQPAFAMTVAGCGAFPNATRPRVVWCGVREGAQELIALHSNLEKALRPLGCPREDRPFTPHITIGRFRRTAANPELEKAIERLGSWAGGAFEVRELLIMASQLSGDGPIYSVMGRGRLTGSDT
jgi:2'-5' RNA ligase